MAKIVPVALAVAIALVAACGAAPPVSFPQGETTWVVPIDAPLASTELVVPAFIHGKGPFLFVLAPDSPVTTIDRGVAESLGLYTRPNSWRQALDSRDRRVPVRPYEILEFRVGDLTARNFVAYSAPKNSLRAGGRKVHGVIGANLLTRTVVLDIDRDRGQVTMSLTGTRAPAEKSIEIPGRIHRVGTLKRRRLVLSTSVEGRSVDLAVDLAAFRSAIRPDVFDEFAAPARTRSVHWTDEFGTSQSTLRSKRLSLTIEGAGKTSMDFAQHPDRRLRYWDYHGVLGQDFLSRYRVRFDPDRRRLALARRDPNLARNFDSRAGRWGTQFARCASVRCAKLSVGGDPRGLTLTGSANAPMHYDVFVEAVGRNGQAAGPLLRVTLGRGKTTTIFPAQLSPDLADSIEYRVVDVSPLVSACGAGCSVPVAGHGAIPSSEIFATPPRSLATLYSPVIAR